MGRQSNSGVPEVQYFTIGGLQYEGMVELRIGAKP